MTIEIVNHSTSAAVIKNFDTARYVSDTFMQQERTHIWQQCWLLAGLSSDLQSPGDFFVFEIGAEQILVTRSNDGEITGFYNVCQHRGNRLVNEPLGHADSFRCAYHAWTYSIDGALRAVPYEERFAAGVPREERGLRRVHTDTWNGFVFVSMADEPPPLLDFLGPLADHLAPYRFDEMTLVEDQTVRHNCNWKAVVDNFSELYHVDFLHPQHKRMVDCCNDTVHLFEHGHTGLAVPGATVNPRFPVPDQPTDIQSAQLRSLGLDPADFTGRVMDVRRAVQLRKREVGHERGINYDAFSDEQLSDVWQYNLFPNVILSFTPEHCWVMRPRPHPTDPQKCYFDKLSLLKYADPKINTEASGVVGPGRAAQQAALKLADDYQQPARDVFDHTAILSGEKTMTDTIDQDIELLGGVQAGMASHGFTDVWLNDDEMRVQHFHNEVERLISAEGSA